MTVHETKYTKWYLYILKCKDNSLYTGITNNPVQRYLKHQSGDAAKYTRSRGVKDLMYLEIYPNKSSALKREIKIKKLSRKEKESLIKF